MDSSVKDPIIDLSEENELVNTNEVNTNEVEEVEEVEEVKEVENVMENISDVDTINSSIQIAPTDESNPIGKEDDPMLFIQLGDRVVIDSKYGRTTGTVYYRSLERISVKPDGVSNTVIDFELEQTEEEELYKEEYGVTAAYVIEKRKFESFTEQQDFRVNQQIDTFDKKGELYKSYKIVKVDKENDYIQIEDGDKINELRFNFIGIESDEEYKVISISQFVEKKEEVEEVVEVEEEEEEEEDEIEIIGDIQIIRPKIYEEAAYFEQTIPDNIQKIDMLNDLLSSIDSSLQNDKRSLRAIRVLVETLFNLKQATIAYNEDGSVKGQKDISVKTLSELINKVHVPLGRPVLDVKKKLYDTSDRKEDDIYFENFQNEYETMIQNKSAIVSSTMIGAPGGKIVREWNDQQQYLKNYLSPWLPNTVEPMWSALTDTDFFRTAPPELSNIDGKNVFENTVYGYIPLSKKDVVFFSDKIPFGIERALETTYRKGADRKKQILLPEESSTLDSYLLFPIKTASSLGITRSSNLAMDSGRSQMKKTTMRSILEKIGGPTDIGTSNDIVLLNIEGNTLSNISLADYIEGISIPSLGLGDIYITINQYGMNYLELTPDIINVIVKKIELYQSQLLTTLSKLREVINEVKEVEQSPFIISTIFEDIKSQITLADDITDYERINPSLKESDIGKAAYLMRKHPDYFQVAVGNNTALLAKAFFAANRQIYTDTLQIAKILKYNEVNIGETPVRNTCRHIRDLVAVRRVKDDMDRFQKLIDFFRKYQGTRDNNWINCNTCKEHLICIHERLQIQEFINPKEKDIIQKEIILKFSGGQFQGKYICRNCGQAIKDIDFDNNIEFDDNGKPIIGNAVIEDSIEDQIYNIVTPTELKFNEEETKCYNIIKEISDKLGVSIDTDGFKTIIIKTITWVNKFPNRNDYNENLKKKLPSLPDYDIAVARNIITAAATFLLLEIQTKIPSYVIKYALRNCKSPGFDGYPLDSDKTKKQGIEYVACAVASIRRNEVPWNQTGFLKVADDKKRQTGIMVYMDSIIKEIISDNIIQSNISEKLKYLSTSTPDRPKDIIPATFLPEQIIVTPEEAAKNVIIPEIAGNVTLWIRQAHSFAKKTEYISHTDCYLSNIKEPGKFSNDVSEYPVGKRTLVPNKQGRFLITKFNPRPKASDIVEPDKELYFRIFLKCCFEGPQKGYTHEPGLTNECLWCGFQFPTIPVIMDIDTEGKSALASQNIATGSDEFVNLLDTIHTVNKVESFKIAAELSITDIMNEFGAMTPPPIKNWQEVLAITTKNIILLPPDADKSEIVIALGPISEAPEDSSRIISERISPLYKGILEEIVKLSWINYFQVIQCYFITPLQRILTQFSSNSLFVPIELKNDLSKIHVENDIIPILDNDISILTLKGDNIKDPKFNLAKSKINYFLKQMSAILQYKNKICPKVIPGEDVTLMYIQRALLYGPIATLINPSEIPQDTEIKSTVKSIGDPSMKYLIDLISITLNKFSKEKLTFSDQQIKEIIAIRNEKERTNIIAEYSKLTDEERSVELMNQRLGLGKYAVGGTKLIYAYDKEYYDVERQKRFAAGIMEFPGSEITDELGFKNYEDDEGYDHREDDE